MPTSPKRETFFDYAAERLAQGDILTPKGLAEIMPKYNYKPGSVDVMDSGGAMTEIAKRGVTLYIERYKGHKIYRDEKLDEDNDGLVNIRHEIDDAMIKRSRPGSKRH